MSPKKYSMKEEAILLFSDLYSVTEDIAKDLYDMAFEDFGKSYEMIPKTAIDQDICNGHSVDTLLSVYGRLSMRGKVSIRGVSDDHVGTERIMELVANKVNLFEQGVTGSFIDMNRIKRAVDYHHALGHVILENIARTNNPDTIRIASRILGNSIDLIKTSKHAATGSYHTKSIVFEEALPKVNSLISERASDNIYRKASNKTIVDIEDYLNKMMVLIDSFGLEGFGAAYEPAFSKEAGHYLIATLLNVVNIDTNSKSIMVGRIIEDGADWHKGILMSDRDNYAAIRIKGESRDKVSDLIDYIGNGEKRGKERLRILKSAFRDIDPNEINSKIPRKSKLFYFDELRDKVFLEGATKGAKKKALTQDLGI